MNARDRKLNMFTVTPYPKPSYIMYDGLGQGMTVPMFIVREKKRS